jgi:uncharacterized protein (TIGR02246 family)
MASSPAKAVPAGGEAAAPAGLTVPKVITQFFRDYFRAVEAGDPEGIMAHIDTDFVIKWPLGQPIQDRERLRTALASLQQRVRQEVQWEVLEARVLGDWAWVRSTETPTHFPKAGGDPRTFSGSRLTILRKVNGRWLLHRDYSSLDELPSASR